MMFLSFALLLARVSDACLLFPFLFSVLMLHCPQAGRAWSPLRSCVWRWTHAVFPDRKMGPAPANAAHVVIDIL